MTTKDDLRGQPPQHLVAEGVDPRRLRAFKTSGSTGQPFTIRRGWLERKVQQAIRIHGLCYLGVRPGDRIAEVTFGRDPAWQRRPLNRLLRRLGLYRMTAIEVMSGPERVLAALRQVRPQVIFGYPETLARVAALLTESDRRVLRPRIIVCCAEVLTPAARRQLRDGFGASVWDWYSSIELGPTAWECRQSGALHVCDESLILEVLHEDRPVAEGERGEIVATSLYSYTMPFIRYRVHDLVTRGRPRCSCDRPSSTIDSLLGRVLDYFPLPDGRLLHPYEVLLPAIWPAAWIGQFQLLQESRDRVLLRLVPAREPAPDELATLREKMLQVLGPGVDLRLERVARIAPGASGKFQTFRSLI